VSESGLMDQPGALVSAVNSKAALLTGSLATIIATLAVACVGLASCRGGTGGASRLDLHEEGDEAPWLA
jgi:hypothetical protein